MRRLLCLPGVLLGLVAPAAAQMRPDTGAFVTMLGNDTLAVERYIRGPLLLQVEALTRVPQTRLLYLTVAWNEAGRLTGYEMIDAPAPGSGGPARIRSIAVVEGDSVRIEVTQGSLPARHRKIPLGGAVPWISPIYSLYAAALAQAPNQPTQITMLSQQGPLRYTAQWRGDSLRLEPPTGGALHITFDERGRMRTLDAAETTFQVQIRAIDWPDIEGLARQFAQRDKGGQQFGLLSPRDTVRANVAGARISIDYSQPARRGRVIFGQVVPWDRVWRTGANAATQLETTRDLAIANVTIPAGKYSLWTLPSRRQWLLIINKQSGQWGTSYDPTQDHARIPIEARPTRDQTERFTITITTEGYGGIMRMSWDRTQLMVPFTVR